jgi:hypothetical protein
LLVHGRWFFPCTLASSTTKTGHHDIAEILLKLSESGVKHNKSNEIIQNSESGVKHNKSNEIIQNISIKFNYCGLNNKHV